jgi:PhzF family phenazine biosynthesis protein
MAMARCGFQEESGTDGSKTRFRMTKLPIFQVDVFARGPFTGNPAAVCPLENWLPGEVMQGIAAENNLSETAFFVKRADDDYDLRWFTPTVEVDLCGHATVASGHVALNILEPTRNSVTFHTRSGPLNVSRTGNMLALNLSARPSSPVNDQQQLDKLEQILGARPTAVLKSVVTIAVFEDEATVRAMRPDFTLMRSLGFDWVSVTAPAADTDTDFVSRYFAPGSGISEDPVTGSAHGWLVPYWADRLGKTNLAARQVSRRGGWLTCELRGDRVVIAGNVLEYLSGTLVVPSAP